MRKHYLHRNNQGEPVCGCGYRPDVLGLAGEKPVGVQWKAKADVLHHIDRVTGQTPKPPRRSPEAPFNPRDPRYPRAGIRQTEDGRWLLTLWDGDQIVHVMDEDDRTHRNLHDAIDQGWLTIGACRKTGTNLNGMPV